MRHAVLGAALVIAGAVGGTAFAAHAGSSALAKAAPKEPEVLEYKFLVLGSADASTGEHEKQLNALATQGWRVVSPIYSGGILNSYLMARARSEK